MKNSARPSSSLERESAAAENPAPLLLSAFTTPLGWIGLLGQRNKLIGIFAGYGSETAIRNQAKSRSGGACLYDDWSPELRELFTAYADGDVVDFSEVEIELPKLTRFRRNIVDATRRLGHGQTASYGELATMAGHPGAARAVGTVMSTNQFPILIPCHRVLAAGGKLGGYTSPAGTKFKLRLLEMEARSVGRTFNLAELR
ncbi:methylated-DNA--[protein]-cysteine S-methyltransferase [Schlesneria sp.]|uniref:methylated-DNA--[protein]-cysteine S-methyltransferase n=1 Tax=Schlesneria sp. TaxID=2762018 RepID=UPI002F168EB0